MKILEAWYTHYKHLLIEMVDDRDFLRFLPYPIESCPERVQRQRLALMDGTALRDLHMYCGTLNARMLIDSFERNYEPRSGPIWCKFDEYMEQFLS